MPTAIEVQDISKLFRRLREKPASLKERLLSVRTRAEDFWALTRRPSRSPQGGTLGLIGPNGSGKTTMLKVIAGILRPTEGVIRQRGRIARCWSSAPGSIPS